MESSVVDGKEVVEIVEWVELGAEGEEDVAKMETLLCAVDGSWWLMRAGYADGYHDAPLEAMAPEQVCEWLLARRGELVACR